MRQQHQHHPPPLHHLHHHHHHHSRHISSSLQNTKAWLLARSLIAGLAIVLLGSVLLSFYLPRTTNYQQQRIRGAENPIRSSSSSHHHHHHQQQQHRLAIIILYASTGLPTTLPYWNVFCKGAAGVSNVADFLIFHTGVLQHLELQEQQQHDATLSLSIRKNACPDNVHFFNLGSERGMAERLLRVLEDDDDDQAEEESIGGPPGRSNKNNKSNNNNNNNHKTKKTPTRIDKEDLLEMLASFVHYRPYGLVEFKPALGHIFADYLLESKYSHWGYTDIDILFGDLERWITDDEWNDYDIVTYSYGDQQRLYVRGQFTFHKNDPKKINQIWRACPYLTNIDERFENILQQKEHYKTESAEGCYSAAILKRNDLKVKYAVKAWTDTQDDGGRIVDSENPQHPVKDTFATHGIYLATSPQTGRQYLYQAKSAGENSKQVARLGPTWLEEHPIYKKDTVPLQQSMGAMELIKEWTPHPQGNKCMYWVLPEYQSQICIGVPIASVENVYWIDGQLYKQRFENVDFAAASTGPIFHFQEWKRHYRFGQLASMHAASNIATYLLTEKGAFPMIGSTISGKRKIKRYSKQILSPLGLDMTEWHGVASSNRSQLQGNIYCASADLDQYKIRMECKSAMIWTDVNATDILVSAPGWKDVDIERDVTLVLTLQINAAQAQDSDTVRAVLDHLTKNLERWHGQPSVAVLFMAGATPKLLEFIQKRLGPESSFCDNHRNLLLAAVYEKEESVVSRKALLNMAIDAVPTRWYISGLELERGLVLSSYSSYLATRVAATKGATSRGNIFYIPQFGFTGDGPHMDLEYLLKEKQVGNVHFVSKFNQQCNENNSVQRQRVLAPLDAQWWKSTNTLLNTAAQDTVFLSAGEALQEFEAKILEMMAGEESSQQQQRQAQRPLLYEDESPIFLVDNAAPHYTELVLTNELVREVEEFSGLACYNALKVAQFVAIGYHLNILPGVFASSTDASRKVFSAGVTSDNMRCSGCLANDETNRVLERIARQEVHRIADIAILSTESLA